MFYLLAFLHTLERWLLHRGTKPTPDPKLSKPRKGYHIERSFGLSVLKAHPEETTGKKSNSQDQPES